MFGKNILLITSTQITYFINVKRKLIQILKAKPTVYIALYIVLGLIIASLFIYTPKENASFPLLRGIIIFYASVLLTKYFIYMVASPWHEVSQQLRLQRTTPTPFNPRVSVLVPTWNEGAGVITTVEGLLKSNYHNLEIIVIDNASQDNTKQNMERLIKRHSKSIKRGKSPKSLAVRYCYEGVQGKGHALNHGLRVASGDIIMSIDADCYIPPETVGNFVKYFIDPTIMAAVGNVRIGNTNTVLGVVQYLEFLFSFYFKKAESLSNTIYIIGGAAGAFRREVFEKIGPYSATNITEDIELSVRIQAAGMRIAYVSDALVYTEGATTLTGLLKQRLRWKRGRFETFAEHRDLFFSTKKEHNKLLTWIMLPLAIFGESQLSFEMLFLLFLFIFSWLTNDFSSFISGIVVVSSMFAVQVLFDRNRDRFGELLLLAPIGWLLFYISTYVEASALFKSIIGYIRKSELKWQKWERQGVFSKPNKI